jgi:hypothetical protein
LVEAGQAGDHLRGHGGRGSRVKRMYGVKRRHSRPGPQLRTREIACYHHSDTDRQADTFGI